MKSFSRQSLSRSEKRFFIIAGATVLLLVGFGFLNTSRNSIPDIKFPNPVNRPKPNGFDYYVAASKAIIPAVPPVDQVNDPTLQTPSQAAVVHSLSRKQSWLKTNARAFSLFKQAMKTTTAHPDVRDEVGGYNGYSRLRELARCKIIEANAHKLNKQPAKAVESSIDCIQMGVDISRDANLIGTLVGTAIQSIGRSPIEDFDVTINQLNVAEARKAARRLEALAKRNPPYLEAIKEERWVTIKSFLDTFKDSGWRGMEKDIPFGDKVKIQFLTPRAIISKVNSDFDQVESEIQKPYDPKAATEAKDEAEVAFLLSPSLVSHARSKSNEARRNVALELLLMRLALRAHRAETGHFPKMLSELAPSYLNEIPLDDYAADKPYNYRLSKNGYELWSVGPDGRNDNGKPIPFKSRAIPSPNTPKRPVSVMHDSLGDFVAGKNR